MIVPLTLAVDYARRGFSVISVGPDKKPLLAWAEFQEQVAGEDQLSPWFESQFHEANIGIVTGAVSGLVVLDADGPEGIAGLEVLNLPETPGSQTGKGRHYFFAHPGRRISNKVRVLPGALSNFTWRSKAQLDSARRSCQRMR